MTESIAPGLHYEAKCKVFVKQLLSQLGLLHSVFHSPTIPHFYTVHAFLRDNDLPDMALAVLHGVSHLQSAEHSADDLVRPAELSPDTPLSPLLRSPVPDTAVTHDRSVITMSTLSDEASPASSDSPLPATAAATAPVASLPTPAAAATLTAAPTVAAAVSVSTVNAAAAAAATAAVSGPLAAAAARRSTTSAGCDTPVAAYSDEVVVVRRKVHRHGTKERVPKKGSKANRTESTSTTGDPADVAAVVSVADHPDSVPASTAPPLAAVHDNHGPAQHDEGSNAAAATIVAHHSGAAAGHARDDHPVADPSEHGQREPTAPSVMATVPASTNELVQPAPEHIAAAAHPSHPTFSMATDHLMPDLPVVSAAIVEPANAGHAPALPHVHVSASSITPPPPVPPPVAAASVAAARTSTLTDHGHGAGGAASPPRVKSNSASPLASPVTLRRVTATTPPTSRTQLAATTPPPAHILGDAPGSPLAIRAALPRADTSTTLPLPASSVHAVLDEQAAQSISSSIVSEQIVPAPVHNNAPSEAIAHEHASFLFHHDAPTPAVDDIDAAAVEPSAVEAPAVATATIEPTAVVAGPGEGSTLGKSDTVQQSLEASGRSSPTSMRSRTASYTSTTLQAPPTEEVAEDEMFEFQRRLVFWKDYASSSLMPHEHAYADRTEKHKMERNGLPPHGWTWDEPDWRLDTDFKPCDANGWQYSNDLTKDWQDSTAPFRGLRRRRYLRIRKRVGRVEGTKDLTKTSRRPTLRAADGAAGRQGAEGYVFGDISRMAFRGLRKFASTVTDLAMRRPGQEDDAAEGQGPADDFDVVGAEEDGAGGVSLSYNREKYLEFLSKIDVEPVPPSLDAQHGKCFGCGSSIPIVDLEDKLRYARLCNLTHHYYCPACHQGVSRLIPWRVFRYGDFKKYPVCIEAVNMLAMMHSDPLLSTKFFVEETAFASDPLRKYQHELRLIGHLRDLLVSQAAYLFACPNVDHTALLKMLWPREHLMQSSTALSLADLVEIYEGTFNSKHTLPTLLQAMVDHCASHIRRCAHCTAADDPRPASAQ